MATPSATSSNTVSNATNNVMLNPSNYVDQMLAIQGMNALQGIFSLKDGITMGTVGKLIAYLTIDGLKLVIQSSIQYVRDNFKPGMLYDNGFVSFLINLIK